MCRQLLPFPSFSSFRLFITFILCVVVFTSRLTQIYALFTFIDCGDHVRLDRFLLQAIVLL